MNNKLDKLITLLEKVSNKKVKLVIKEYEIFIPSRLPQKMKDKIIKDRFDKNCEFNHSKKELIYNSNIDITNYNILLEFYKNYLVNVNGNVRLTRQDLNSIDIKFGKVTESFYCSFNNLTSLENCPKYVGKDFLCSHNNKQFTEQEVKEKCKVSGRIIV